MSNSYSDETAFMDMVRRLQERAREIARLSVLTALAPDGSPKHARLKEAVEAEFALLEADLAVAAAWRTETVGGLGAKAELVREVSLLGIHSNGLHALARTLAEDVIVCLAEVDATEAAQAESAREPLELEGGCTLHELRPRTLH